MISSYRFRRIYHVHERQQNISTNRSHRLTNIDLTLWKYIRNYPSPHSLFRSDTHHQESKASQVAAKKYDAKKNSDWLLKAFFQGFVCCFFVSSKKGIRWYLRWYDKCQTNKTRTETPRHRYTFDIWMKGWWANGRANKIKDKKGNRNRCWWVCVRCCCYMFQRMNS